MTVRIGAVSYLNTKPLIYGLEDRLTDGQLILDLPSRLADQLHDGDLDIALIPSVEYLRGSPDWSIVSDACIACHGAVRSVRVLFRREPHLVGSLALDEGSRTSAALAQVLLHDRFHLRPTLQPLPITADFEECDADAVLIIGDRAMQIDPKQYVAVWDLGDQWQRSTGLPFVFAMWISSHQPGSDWDETKIAQLLESSRDQGLAAASQIAAQQADHYHLTADDCRRYFTEQLHFQLGPRERQGLELFRQRADRLGLLSPTARLGSGSLYVAKKGLSDG